MKENIKIALIAIIAFTVVVDTFFLDDGPSRKNSNEGSVAPQSNIVANPSPNNIINPITSPTHEPVNPPTPKLSDTREKTSMEFPIMAHDFGNIEQDTRNVHVFKFKNTGKVPLIIEDAKGSCGCTVPTFPKEPVKPGEMGEIEVVYSPGKQQGAQTKTVTITANTNPITTTLTINANVQVPK